MKNIIITNNKDIKTAFNDGRYQLIILESADYLAVLERVRDAVHKGHKLLTHPLSGSIKPYETPYKSVALSGAVAALDMMSLQTIENAIIKAQHFKSQMTLNRRLSEKILADFRLIDLQLIANALQNDK